MKTVTLTEEQLTKAILSAAVDHADEFAKEKEVDPKFSFLLMLVGAAIAKGVAAEFFKEEETDESNN